MGFGIVEVFHKRQRTLTVSLPIPLVPPVTKYTCRRCQARCKADLTLVKTLPVKSGMLSAVHRGLGGKTCERMLKSIEMLNMVHGYAKVGNCRSFASYLPLTSASRTVLLRGVDGTLSALGLQLAKITPMRVSRGLCGTWNVLLHSKSPASPLRTLLPAHLISLPFRCLFLGRRFTMSAAA